LSEFTIGLVGRQLGVNFPYLYYHLFDGGLSSTTLDS